MNHRRFYPKRASLAAALSGLCSLSLPQASAQTTYTWNNTAGGSLNWSTGTNWSGAAVPSPVSGDTVDFSTINLAANTVLTLDADRTAGIWKFGDTASTQTWTVSAGNTMTLAGPTPTIQVVTNTTTLSNTVAGTSGFTKAGAGNLTLTNTSNNITGDVTIGGGTLAFGNLNAWGGSGKNVSFTGSGTLTTPDNYSGGQISVGFGFTATLSAANLTFASVTGSGNIIFTTGNKTLTLTDASAFQGSIRSSAGGNGQTIRFASMGDASGAGNLQFGGGSQDSNQKITISLFDDAGPLTLNNRKIEFLPKPANWSFRTAVLENNNANAANTFAINTALVNITDRDHEFQLGGTNTGNNLFAGVIGNSTRGTYYNAATGKLSLIKAGTGTWILSGNNTYGGPTTVTGGTLAVSSIDNATNPNPLGQSPAAAANLLLGNGTTLKYTGGTASTDRGITINGTSAGHQATLNASGTGSVSFTNPASPAYGTTAQTRGLNLSGTNTGDNTLAALIADNGGSAVSVSKSGTGTWVLSNTNTYAGDTIISGGVLRASEGGGLSANSLLTLNGGAIEPGGNFARAAGNSAGKIRLTGGASGFSARGGDIQVAIGTLESPAALVMGSATFVPGTLVLNADTADSKLTFLNAVNISGFNFQVNVGAATAEMSGVLSGDLTGSVTKTGSGTLVLSGNNTFQGDVAVNGGTLSLPQPTLSQYANVTVAVGTVLNLNFTGTTSVASLTLGDVPKAPGAYNSTNAAPFITGTGVIFVNGGDADEDGMPDGWELLYGFNPNDATDATADADGDGLTNVEEYVATTGPRIADTDGDGLTDGQELNGLIIDDEVVLLGTSPLKPDTDGDGVTEGEEVTAGSNPLLVDTDADGAPDWYEVKASFTNPALSSSKPIVPYPLPRPSAAAGAANKPVKVFILSGQSNMVGMGDVTPLGRPGTLSTIVKQQGRFPNFLNADGSWSVNNDVWYRSVVTEPDDAALTVGQGGGDAIGPELGFGRVLGYALDEQVLLIKSAQGNRALGWEFLPPASPSYTYGSNTYAGYGQSPASWLTGSTPATGGWYAGKQYDECFLNEADWSPAATTIGSAPVDNVVDVLDNFAAQYPQWAAQGFQIAGYVWFQGNKDIGTGPPYSTRYETHMVQFIKELRTYYANRYPGKCTITTPFVLATGCGDPGTSGNGLVVANAQLAASDTALHPEFTGNVRTMDTRPYWRQVAVSPDDQGYHYNRNAETFALTGDALGRGMLELLGGISDTTPPALSSLTPATTTTNVGTGTNFSATFDEVIVAGTGNLLLKNLTDGTSTSIPITDAAQVTTFGAVLTINPTTYLKPNKQYAIQIPVGAIKDYTGNAFVGINDDVTWTFTSGQGDSLTAALIALTDHVTGVSISSSEQIAAHKTTIDGLKDRMGEDELIIESAFDLVRAYDAVYGALWVAPVQLTRSAETGNLQWTIYRVMQSIMDYVYTRGNIVAFPDLINGFKFGSSSNFPGACPAPPANASHTVEVNASFPDTFGRDTQGWTSPARRPTGAYLAPGTIATVTVPAALVNAGYKIRVGAHSWDFSNRPYLKRLDRSTVQYDIIGTDVKIASPLGGGIYIETPKNASAGVVNVTITGAVRAPFFQNTSFHQTSLAEWLATERTNPAPWADFQTDKFMMQVPRSWIYAHPDPLTVLNDWDSSMDATNDLMGFPHLRGKDTMYLQVDVMNRSSVFAPGYPTVNVSYSPTTDYGGYINNYLVRGPQYSPDYTFHEQGHSYFFTKFGGESESAVNLLYIPVLNQKFGASMDNAFKRSFSTYNPNIPSVGFKDNVAVLWMTSFNFSPREQPMEDWEKSYQHQGHAKFVDIAQLYGWGALNSFWYYYNDKDSNNITVPKDNDSLMVKLCETSGADVRPLLHFWGVPPGDAANLASRVSGLGLTPPVEIYDLLMHYKSKLPTNNASYQAFCLLYYGRQPTINGYGVEREHARQWNTTLQNGTNNQQRFPTEIYDEAAFTAVSARVQEIIDLYYPAGRPPSNNARLADLQPSVGVLSPGFNGTTFGYSNVVPYSTTSMTITPVASDPSASITINGVPVASGSPSGAIDVSPATTVLNIAVVSSDTTVTNTYTVTVTHAEASANANLANLVSNTGTLSPVFASSTTSYSATVPYAVDSLTITPTAAQSGATITVHGSPVASGSTSGTIALNVGTNIITTVVVPENLGTSKTYTLTVQRTADAGLSSLATSAGTLAPAFSTPTFNYIATVSFGTTSLTVTPTASDPSASITVNGSSVATGNPSGPISLVVGNNVITTVVVSQDQSATNTYTLTVTRVTPGSRWWDGSTTNIAGNGNGASAGGNGTWDTSIQNWDQGGNLPYVAWDNGNNDTAVFAGTAGTVTLGANANASGLRFDSANYILSGGTLTLNSLATITANANATVSSTIAGSNGLTKAGGSTLTLNGTNTFTGGVTVSGGTLAFSGSASAWGGSGKNVAFAGTGTLTSPDYSGGQISVDSGFTATVTAANLTFATVIGSGNIIFATGNKTLTLGDASNFQGSIRSSAGGNGQTIRFASMGDEIGAGNLQFGGGSLDGGQKITIALYNDAGPLTLNNREIEFRPKPNNWSFKTAILENNNANAANKFVINTALLNAQDRDHEFQLSGGNAGNNEFAGVIGNSTRGTYYSQGGTGMLSLIKAGTGTWALTGTNTFTGPTTISAGTLSVNSITHVGGGASALGAPTTVPTGTIAIGSSTTTAGTLKYTGTGTITDRVLNLAATTTGAATVDQSGTGLLKFSSDITNPGTGAKSFTLQGSSAGMGEFAGKIVNGSGAGTLALSKSGTGTWSLTGDNSYTGTTAINGGKLLVNGDQTLANGAFNVSANATLGGTGTLGGNTTISATGKLEFNLSTNAASHNKLDLAAAKTLTFSGASTLTITASGSVPPGDFTLVTAPGGFGTSVAPATVVLPATWIAGPARFVGNDLKINITYTGVVTSPFDTWAVSFPALTNSAAALDFDNGSLPTGIEWVVGGNPSIGSDDTGLAPTLDNTTDPNGKLLFIFGRTNAAGADAHTTIRVEYGNNLSGWTPATHQGTGPDDITISEQPNGFGAGIDKVTVALPPSLAATGKLFARLKVAITP